MINGKPHIFIKRTLNACIEHHTFDVYTLFMLFQKRILTSGMRNIHFTIPWKALYLHSTTHALNYRVFFLETYV